MQSRIIITHILNNIVQFTLCNYNTPIGFARYSVQNQTAILNNLHIDPDYRKQGHGSRFMRTAEDVMKHHFAIRQMNLTAWQPAGSYEIVDFYIKNGFVLSNQPIGTYDDYRVLYDLYSMCKPLC